MKNMVESVSSAAKLSYPGDGKHHDTAMQIAQLVGAQHTKNLREGLGARDANPAPITVEVNDSGLVDIRSADSSPGGVQAGGLLLGELKGIAAEKRISTKVQYGAGLQFDSLADLAQTVNSFAKTQDEKIDVAALRQTRR